MSEWLDDLRERADGNFALVKDRQWERKSVRYLLRIHDMQRGFEEVVRAEIGDPVEYSWEEFNQVCDDFPILLSSRSVPYLAEEAVCQPEKFFRYFRSSRMVVAYDEVHAEFGDDPEKSFGLVVPFSGYENGLLLHNSTRPFHDGPCWSITTGDGRILWVELFAEAAKTVRKTWTPSWA